jgi:uncharacterized protein
MVHRVVFDTSTLLAVCIYPSRLPARVFRQALLSCELVVSHATLAELQAVLLRDKFNRWRALDERMAWYDLYAESTKLLPITVNVSDCRDPKDDKFLSLALAANADVIVSSDEDLRVLHPYRGIAIVDVVTFSQQYL